MNFKFEYLLIGLGVVLLLAGISGHFNEETNIGIDLVGVGLILFGIILLWGRGATGSYAGASLHLGGA